MSSQTNTLETLLSTARDLEVFLARTLELKEIAVGALEIALERSRAAASAVAAELAEKRRVIQETEAALAEAEAAAAAPAKEGRTWRVSDCHSYCPSGSWALEATESGTYGVGVQPSPSDSHNLYLPLSSGGGVRVSKARYLGAKDIAVGDTLFMGDKKRGVVFKGVVTWQYVKGVFRSAEIPTVSFRRRVGDRDRAAGKASDLGFQHEEAEMVWAVTWTPVAALTPEWKKYLSFSEYRTVVPLSGAPPA